MAPLPPDSTPRYKVNYSVVGGDPHDLIIRAPAPVSPATFGTFIDGFFTALAPEMYGITLSTVDWAPSGSNIFNPVVTGFEGTTYGTGTQPAQAKPAALSFIGRSSDGRRGRLFVFGPKFGDDTYRFNFGENTAVDAAIDVLRGEAGWPLGIGGVELVWKSYANFGYNDHYIKKMRG